MVQQAVVLDGNERRTLGYALANKAQRTESLTANRTLTAKDAGTLFLCNKAASLAITLPALTNLEVGTTFEFVVQTAVSGGDLTITAQTGDLLVGKVLNYDTDSTNATAFYAGDGSDDLIFTLNGSTKGGIGYDKVTFKATSPTQWLVDGVVYATGNAATPFS